MNRITLAALSLVALASCAPPPPASPTTRPQRPTATLPQAPSQSTRPWLPRNEPRDLCSARSMQYLVGKPRTEIPVPVDVSRRRVACTTCPVTQDYREDRLNIFFDADTGIIKEVKCG